MDLAKEAFRQPPIRPRQWVDGSSPFYFGAIDSSLIPPTAVGGYFKSELFIAPQG